MILQSHQFGGDRHRIYQDCTILFKGSRVAKLEQIIKKLCV
jgi:UDP-N-acetylmuramyl pentapeptide synthase